MQSTAGLASHSYWFAIRRLFAIVLVAYAGGCVMVAKIPRDQEVDLQFDWIRLPGERISITNKAITGDAGIGATGGGLVGAGIGLGCGPWAPLCVPVAALAGILAGGAAGAGVGVLESWERGQVELLSNRLNDYFAKRDLPAQLNRALLDRARSTWKLGKGPTAAVVRVELREFSFQTFRANRGALFARVDVKPGFPNSGSRWFIEEKVYQLHSQARSADEWLRISDDDLDREFDLMYRRIADSDLLDLTSR